MAYLFISYSRKDFPIVDRLRNDLRDAGLEVWIDRVGLTPGTLSWEQALRDAIHDADAVLLCASADSRESPYVRDEVALAKQASKAIYPAWVAGENWLDCIPLGLGGTQYADLRGDQYAAGLMQLVAAIRGEATTIAPLTPEEPPVPAAPPDFIPRNPYKGLRAYRAEDAGDFFGRAALVADLCQQVEETGRAARLLAVLGPSGSGKSSVMMAGLLPRLRDKHPDWLYLDPMVPGSQPLERLTITLARQFKHKAQAAIREDLLDGSTRGLHRLASEMSDRPVVLYIDQFEEVFTQVSDEAERRQFIDLLGTAASEPDGVLYLLLSMRADFYDRPLQFTPFGKLIETHHAAITPMTLADLYDVVQKPAALPDARLTFDDGLVTEMIFDVREEAAALPLLQFTLDQLFQRRDGQRLTLSAYREMGGIRGALARHAEATYNGLPSEAHRALARSLFLRLIEPGQTEQDTTRRRAPYSELTLPDAEQTRLLQDTAAAFVDARLLVSDSPLPEGDSDQNAPLPAQRSGASAESRTIEVSHEALIREWARLAGWLHDAREDLRLQKSLAADVAEWRRRGRPDDRLYRGTVLAEALAWAERNSASVYETAFLDAARRVEADRARREAAAARTLRLALFGLVAVIVVASVGMALIFARSNAALQAEVDFTNLEIARFGTLRAGDVIVPLGTQTPGIFEPTMTAIAALAAHDPSLPENQMTDEHGIEMVRVPSGCFYMGSDRGESNEQPTHQVCFTEPFWIDKTEVTNAAYRACVEARACQPPEPSSADYPDYYDDPTYAGHPVVWVDWFMARDYAAWRGGRLPSEAEWEYAARGPDSRVYPWGNEWAAENAVTYETSGGQTAPVGSRPGGVSWVGALNMSGNVWEWTNTIYKPYPYDAGDGREADTRDSTDVLRVLRGGSWNYHLNFARAAYRDWYNPYFRLYDLGFRVVLGGVPS